MSDLKYGYRHGPSQIDTVKMAASQAVAARSGRFVFLDAANSNRATLNVNGSAQIWGHLQSYEHTPAVDDAEACNISTDAIYRIPINSGTYVVGMKGDTCDISIVSGIQGAQLDAADEDTLIIVDGDLENNEWVDVKINVAKQGTGTGVV